MGRIEWIGVLLAGALFLTATGGSAAGPGGGTTDLAAAAGDEYGLDASLSVGDVEVSAPDTWRLGAMEGPTAPAGSGPVGHVAHWESGRGEAYLVFPGPALQTTVQEAWFCVLDRTGSYGGAAELTLAVLDYAGNIVRTASVAPVDVATATVGQWTAIPVTPDLAIVPGEALAFRLRPVDGAGGDLTADVMFEAQAGNRVFTGAPWAYLPNLLRGY